MVHGHIATAEQCSVEQRREGKGRGVVPEALNLFEQLALGLLMLPLLLDRGERGMEGRSADRAVLKHSHTG